MKIKGLAHAVILSGLLVLLALFLSAFLWTCFQEVPSVAEPANEIITPVEKVAPPPIQEEIPVPNLPPEVEKQISPVVEEPVPSIPEQSDVLPPPNHLLRLPVFPKKNVITISESPKVPNAPTFASVSNKLYVPEAPYMFEPLVLTEDEYDMFFPSETADPAEDDFWADFFVVGQDEVIAYDDGNYYLGLYVNDEYVGDIEVEFAGEKQSLNASELSLFIGDYVTDDAYARIFGTEESYLSLEELMGKDIEARYDSAAFAIFLTFNLDDMPERTISITSSSINRREQYGMSGAITLKPAKFAMSSSLSLYTLFDYPSDFSILNNNLISLSVSNRLSFLGIGLNFYFSLTSKSPYFTMGTWNGFYDFVETNHRLSFGNVGSNLNTTNVGSSTSFGIAFEKNYSYGTGSAKGNQFEYRIVLVEPSNVTVSINGKDVYGPRLFQAGTYRLKDFVFTQGANVVKITIVPDARPEDVIVNYVDMGYDYRLLGKGDSLYNFSFSVPQVISATPSAVINLPYFNGQYLSYHMDKFTATYTQQTGITDTFTFTSDLAITPGFFSGTLNGVFASMIGTTQLQVTLGLDGSKVSPSFTGNLSHRFSGALQSSLGSLGVGLNYSIPARDTLSSAFQSTIGGNISYSGSFTKDIRYTLTGTISKNSDNAAPSWNASFSTGFSPFRGMSISGSLSASGSATDPFNPSLTGQISGSYSFSPKLNASSSTSVQTSNMFADVTTTTSMGLGYRPSGNDSLSLSLSGLKPSDPLNHSLVGTWSHSGDLSSFTLRQQATSNYQRMVTTLTANTSLAYADGAFALAKSVNDSFFLVKPVGDLKKSDVSVARTLDSSPTVLLRPLGSALYNNITTNTRNNIVVFSTGATDYSTGASFVYEMTPRSRQSFVAKIDVEPSFTVSGLLFQTDGSAYQQYSSPVYAIELNQDGDEIMIRNDELYLFTDQDGRFILSDVRPGTYLFDLKVDDLWYAVKFEVPQVESDTIGLDRVLLLEDFWVSDPQFEERIIVQDAFSGEQIEEETDVFGSELVTGYDASVTLNVIDRLNEESFWTIIFPPFEESDWNFEELDSEYVTEEDYYFDEALWDDVINSESETETATQVFTAAP